MGRNEKLKCDSCGKEALETDTTDWVKALIQDKDFCSKRCASKYVKNEYEEEEESGDEEDVEDTEETVEQDKEYKPKIKKVKEDSTPEDIWELKSVASQFQQGIVNKETGEIIELTQLVINIANKLEEISRRL